MLFASKRAVRMILTLLAFSFVATAGFSRTFYDVSRVNPFDWWLLLGIVIIQIRVLPYWIEGSLVILATALFSFYAFDLRGLEPALSSVCCYAGLSSWAVLALRTIWATPETNVRVGLLPALIASCLFIGFTYLAAPVLYYAEQLQPNTLDLYLISFDGSLGFQPSFLVGKYYWGFPWLRHVALLAYLGLPLALALTYVENLTRRRERAASVGMGMFYLGLVGIFAYNLFPATGPVHVFGGLFPGHPLGTEQARTLPLSSIPVTGSRNAIPSLHMAWILWCWWWVRGLQPWLKAIILWFVLFTVVATLGTGEHYLIDLVVALPFTLMICAAFTPAVPWRNADRLTALIAGLVGTLLWFVLLRHTPRLFWISPAVPWAMVLATLVLVYWLKFRLFRSLDALAPLAASSSVPDLSSADVASSSAV